jgi:hypothetical protein
MSMAFKFNSLLEDAGIDPGQVRLLRHQPKVAGRSLLDIWRTDQTLLEDYQSLQLIAKRAHFARPFWASFIGTWDGRTVFVGLYEIGEPTAICESVIAPISGGLEEANIFDRYPTIRSSSLNAYEGRLYIDWGGGSAGKRAWVQRAETQNKLITELHLAGVEEPFPGMLELAKPLSELADAPPGWIQRLAAARGVYLLACPRDGSLYVGSAAAEGGFWSRWAEYRANGHGGNVALVGRDPSDFVVSVLQVAGSADSADDVLAAEAVWKTKLQTRRLGPQLEAS